MNLPDFLQFEPLTKLREMMDASVTNWHPVLLPQITQEEGEKLRKIGLEVDPQEIEVVDDGTLEYKGQKIVVYIRDQHQGYRTQGDGYKFHFAECQTLIQMKSQNRYGARYVVTTRRDGKFPVTILDSRSYKRRTVERELRVCKNCLAKLSYKGYQNEHWGGDIYKTFSLSEFFEIYQSSIQQIPLHSAESGPVNDYPQDWPEISRRYRESVGWKCEGEECGRDMSSAKGDLHVHHRNFEKWDCDDNNLEALCRECHMKKPGHKIMPGKRTG